MVAQEAGVKDRASELRLWGTVTFVTSLGVADASEGSVAVAGRGQAWEPCWSVDTTARVLTTLNTWARAGPAKPRTRKATCRLSGAGGRRGGGTAFYQFISPKAE